MLKIGRLLCVVVSAFVAGLLAGSVPAPAVAAIDLVDTSFNNPNVGSFAMSMAVQSDGKILVGGTFTTAGPNNTPYGRLARFNADG